MVVCDFVFSFGSLGLQVLVAAVGLQDVVLHYLVLQFVVWDVGFVHFVNQFAFDFVHALSALPHFVDLVQGHDHLLFSVFDLLLGGLTFGNFFINVMVFFLF